MIRNYADGGEVPQLQAVGRSEPGLLLAALLPGEGGGQCGGAVQPLAAGVGEEDQGHLGGGQGIGAGVVALLHLQAEMLGPLVQPAVADAGVGAEQGASSAMSRNGRRSRRPRSWRKARASMRWSKGAWKASTGLSPR